ncbi:hypothetical protein [Actinacidiphila sp. ITFR-21]|uniref:hypothetical protein n=1 Tax=Actinacidiphila sp. ITFR-21 TaxID=3075199 RepID=UPI00288B4A53|nr:hypothetical protein [Streptomyces sp. ITFR-21]WNI19273.1 hypothetical protein RLT57_29480 [Streptomyces sp. ITFR-21]
MLRRVPGSDGLRAELGRLTGVRAIRSSPRSRLWAGTVPVVVKHVVAGSGASARFGREVATFHVAGRAGKPVAAPLLAADRAARVMVLARVGRRPAPADWVVGCLEALARLHATGRPRDAAVLPVWTGPTAADADAFRGFATALGVSAGPRARRQLLGAVRRLADGAAGQHALPHGDP